MPAHGPRGSRATRRGPSGGTVKRALALALLLVVITPSRLQTASAANPLQTGGVVLDGWGGLHPFGGYNLDTTGAPYWPGYDIARALVVRNDGAGGWLLDGAGAVHAFGRAKDVGDHLTWPGQDVARALVITSYDAAGDTGELQDGSDAVQGYILDEHGGVNPFGGAPRLTIPAYWPDWDVAAGLDVHLSASGAPDGLLVSDVSGGLHYAGNYPVVRLAPAYHAGHAVYQRIGRTNDGRLYTVMRYGQVVPMGGRDLSRMPMNAAGPSGARALSAQGLQPLWLAEDGSTPSPVQLLQPLSPFWSGYSDWGRWDILRDIAIMRSDNLLPTPEPMSPAAADQLQNALTDLHTVSLPAPSLRQSMPLDCEAAATAAALRTLGVGTTQAWVMSQLPVDQRAAQLSGGRPVRWGDAWTSFVGNVYGSENNFTGYGVYWQPIVDIVQRAGRTAFGGQGWAINDLFAELDRGHPSVIWINNSYHHVNPSYWTGWDGATVPYTLGDHAVLLYGVNFEASSVQIMDVAHGTFRSFSIAQFTDFMSTYNNMAVVVQ
ncbi:MAG TPA: C39 family peptidase [Candidatus Dormibacteraeota bacterium]|nr:C39 family peptidase [Candidatus Dormibacteraeota bacterium]